MLTTQEISRCKDILLYDGVCALCNRFVKFVLKHDTAARFCFASLSSDYGRATMERHGAGAVDSAGLLLDANSAQPKLLLRSDVPIYVMSQLAGPWPFLARLLRAFPRPLRDYGYSSVAGTRYRIFGKYDVCPLPAPDVRSRFIAL